MTNCTTTLPCQQDLVSGNGIPTHTSMGAAELLPTIQRTELVAMRLHYLFRWAPSHQPVSALQRAVFCYRGVAL
jgi:hypothetical protein